MCEIAARCVAVLPHALESSNGYYVNYKICLNKYDGNPFP